MKTLFRTILFFSLSGFLHAADLIFDGPANLRWNASTFTVVGTLQSSTLAANQCIHSDATGNLVSTGSDCGSSGGTLTGVTAGYGLTGGGTSGTVILNLATNATAYIQNNVTGISGSTATVTFINATSSATVLGPLHVTGNVVGGGSFSPSNDATASYNNVTISLHNGGGVGTFQNNTATAGSSLLLKGGGGTDSVINFNAGNAVRMGINSSGFLGIAKSTGSTSFPLDVAGYIQSSSGVYFSNGSNFVMFKSSAASVSNSTYTWPTAYPASTQFLQSDTTGNITFSSGISVSTSGVISALHFAGNSAIPTISTGAASGTVTNSASLTGTDVAGQITVNTGGATLGSAILATINFSKAYDSAPYVVIWPSSINAAQLSGLSEIYVTSTSSSFSLNTSTTGLGTTAGFTWMYIVVQ